jgi:oxygen-independent coproporphyrinogen-3 oxidase
VLPEEETQAEMYDEAVRSCEAAGLRQYEISNFAKPGFECRHNLAYWRNEEYIGYGPGAVERVGDVRRTNLKHPKAYCESIESGMDTSCEREVLDDAAHERERIMLGLRLNAGLNWLDPHTVHPLIEKGWATFEDDKVTLTPLGRHYCNQAIVALL